MIKIIRCLVTIVLIPFMVYGGATITRGKTFSSTEEVTNTDLHQLVDSATFTRMTDADGDTKVDTEESSDEDKVRVDTGGTERLIIDSIGGRFSIPSAETITAGATITANACGTIKQITAAGEVTTDTTNTFTAPATANKGCCMDVVNIGSNAITLDENTNFVSAGNVALGAGDACRVCSNGTTWYEIGASDN